MMTLDKFEEASEKVKEVVLPTNLIYSEYFSEQTGNKVYLKPENMQYTGAYKVRGAYYKISTDVIGRKRKRIDYGICRKSCAGSCLRGQIIWCSGNDRNADNDAVDKSESNERLWR